MRETPRFGQPMMGNKVIVIYNERKFF